MATKKQSDLLVITKTRDLANYVFTITHKSPKEYRFSIVIRMQNYVLDAVENLYRANAVQLTPQTVMNREHYQREAMTAYRLLGTVAQIGGEQGASKTQVFPISHGVEYLGWRFYLTDSGAVIRRLKKHSKIRWKHRLRKLKSLYADGSIDIAKIHESTQSFVNHMSYGNTWRLYHRVMSRFVLVRTANDSSRLS